MDELLEQFLIEGAELVLEASDALLVLERSPRHPAAIDTAFRALHTLKGSVGLFDLPAMGRALHSAEDVLSRVRSGAADADGPTVSYLLGVLGKVDRWLHDLGATGVMPPDIVAEDMAADGGNGVAAIAPANGGTLPSIGASDDGGWAQDVLAQMTGLDRDGTVQVIRYRPTADAYFNGDDPIAILAAVPGLVHLRLSLADDDGDAPYDPFTCRLQIDAVSQAGVEAVRAAFRLVADQVQVASVAARPGVAEHEALSGRTFSRSLRVSVARIDALSALGNEMLAASAALSAAAAAGQSGANIEALSDALAVHAAGVARLSQRIHAGVESLRTTPIGPILRRFPRVLREIGEQLGKDVEIIIDDGGVEADKAVLDGLTDPLMHLLRNAIDHGVEPPDQRLAAGKPRRAQITVVAREIAGRLNILLADDGRGIDPERIRAVAAERMIQTPAALAALSDAEVIQLVFAPGFSTAAKVTDLSGRGVGMDAVRVAVQALGGRVLLSSELGRGSTVELVVPLAVSLTKVLVIEHGGERYGLALESVLETLRVRAANIAAIRGGHAFNWRGRVAALVPLTAVTGGDARLGAGDQLVVMVRAGEHPLGLAIDRIADRLDVAVRPLDGLLAGMPGITGAAVLGDGQVLMILETEAMNP